MMTNTALRITQSHQVPAMWLPCHQTPSILLEGHHLGCRMKAVSSRTQTITINRCSTPICNQKVCTFTPDALLQLNPAV